MEQRIVRIGCEFEFSAAVETPAVMQVEPAAEESLLAGSPAFMIEPNRPSHQYRDLYGNLCRRLVLPAGQSTVRYQARAVVPDATEAVNEQATEAAAIDLPDHVLMYTLPSRYVLPDLLGDDAWARFGSVTPGYGRAQAICDYVNNHLTFAYGSSGPQSTAVDVYRSGYGVCRDFTHLAMSFCRALNIPARYVFGYLPDMDVPVNPDPMDFAAWMEVWLSDQWWTFDPRNNEHRKGRIVIGRGRDASDVAMVTSFGGPQLQSMTVVCEEEPR